MTWGAVTEQLARLDSETPSTALCAATVKYKAGFSTYSCRICRTRSAECWTVTCAWGSLWRWHKLNWLTFCPQINYVQKFQTPSATCTTRVWVLIMEGYQEEKFLILAGSKIHAVILSHRGLRLWECLILSFLEIKCGFAVIANNSGFAVCLKHTFEWCDNLGCILS